MDGAMREAKQLNVHAAGRQRLGRWIMDAWPIHRIHFTRIGVVVGMRVKGAMDPISPYRR
jgi:hypothetical protein